MFKKEALLYIDWTIVLSIFIIMIIGFINSYSASHSMGYAFYAKQLTWYAIGLFIMIFFLFFDYKLLIHLTNYMQIGVIILLVLILLIGKTSGGSQRWISFGFFNLQPSEFAKLSGVLLLSSFFATNEKIGYQIWELWKPLILLLITFLLIFKQPDFGTAGIILLISGTLIFLAGIKWLSFIGILILAITALPILWRFLKPYQIDRILTFFNPSADPLGSSYHVIQSKIAVGSGQFFGKGFMEGTQTQLAFLPEAHTDFAFSIWAEEWGFIGCMFLLGAFFILLSRGIAISLSAKDRFGSFIAMGVTAMLFWQIIINVSMILGLFPVVGVPLPLISYGGSSAITTFAGIGLLLSINAKKTFFT
jgi:rod shape determining protein RodA